MAWCLAKIILLFDPSCNSIPPPSDVDKTLQAHFKLAQNLTTTQAEENSDESKWALGFELLQRWEALEDPRTCLQKLCEAKAQRDYSYRSGCKD